MAAKLVLRSPADDQELEQLRILKNKLRNWIDEYKILCSESLYQRSSIGDEGLKELAEIVCDDLGYYEESDNKPKVTEGPFGEYEG